MQKEIKAIHSKQFEEAFPGLMTIDISHTQHPTEPFLVFTEYMMQNPVFGPHPHAGVSVMTYMHPDSETVFFNRDSHGDQSIIDAGGVHVTQAGSGIMHDEVPEIKGKTAHGFQIWVNHSEKNRLVEPKGLHVNAADIPEVKFEGGKVRIIHGKFQGWSSPLQMVTPVTLYDVYMDAQQELTLPAERMAFILSISGGATVDATTIEAHDVVYFKEDEGTSVTIKTGDLGVNFLFASGKPHNEPIIYGGPYVMSSEEQLRDTKKRFANGEMGYLKPLGNH